MTTEDTKATASTTVPVVNQAQPQQQAAPAAQPQQPVKQPTITSKNLPPTVPSSTTQSPSEQAQTLSDDQIVARPLIDPDFTNLKPKNPNYVFRWVNRVAGGGSRFEKMKASGFRVATYSDVSGDVPEHFKKNNSIINGDLILTIISRELYVGALKHNEQKAHKRLHKGFALQTGKKAMQEALNEVPGSSANKSKIKLYEPGL